MFKLSFSRSSLLGWINYLAKQLLRPYLFACSRLKIPLSASLLSAESVFTESANLLSLKRKWFKKWPLPWLFAKRVFSFIYDCAEHIISYCFLCIYLITVSPFIAYCNLSFPSNCFRGIKLRIAENHVSNWFYGAPGKIRLRTHMLLKLLWSNISEQLGF
jgi:hypothetical protein